MPEPLTPRADLPSPTEGDDYQYRVSFTDGTGSPIDITGWTVSMTIAEQGASGAPLVEKDITTHDDATGGTTSWSVSASDTSGVTGTKRYDIQVVKSDGTTRTVVIGTIGFTDGVTDRDIAGSGGSGAGASAGASIDVTLDGDDSVAINVRGLTNYTDSDAVGALDGATITPGQVGTEANPVKQQHAEAISSGELSVNEYGGIPIDNSTANGRWHKVGTITGNGASVNLIITETSRTGQATDTGTTKAKFSNGSAAQDHGGYWYTEGAQGGDHDEAAFAYLHTADGTADVYYKAGPYTMGELFVLRGTGFTLDFQADIANPNGTLLPEERTHKSPTEFKAPVSAQDATIADATLNGVSTEPTTEAVRPLETTGYLTTGRSEYKHGLNLSGTRESAWIRPMVWQDTDFTNTTYQEVAPGMYIGPIECPPGKVPVLRMWADIVSNDTGETASVNITNGKRGTGSPFYEFTTGTGTNALQTYREVYLNEENYGTATRDMNTHALSIQTKVSGGTNGGTLHGRSAVGLDYEVI